MKEIISIIIPVYNEGPVIEDVIRTIEKKKYSHIIVVDDGSSDETYTEAKKTSAIVLRHFLNRGKGAAVKTGLEAAKMLKSDIVVTIDGDGQHDTNEIKELIEQVRKGYDIVLGSRKMDAQSMPLFNRLANKVGNVITWMIFGLWVNDSQSGFRAFSRKALNAIETNGDRYEYDTELLQNISRHMLKFTEVPISVRYTHYSQTKRTKQSFTNGLRTVFRLIRT